jgi:S-adenosylmethionine:tRNA ribosyltransferase-isomerase
MESLFVVGARIAAGVLPETAFVHVDQWAAFDESLSDVSRAQAFTALQEWMQTKQLENLWGQTSIMIAPGCRIASADALITNFHQPGNTLMLLVAAFMGEENWRNLYNSALENDYRFLSYGDSSLLVR